jgi:hypothetical protein
MRETTTIGWFEKKWLTKLAALREPGESYSDVILGGS